MKEKEIQLTLPESANTLKEKSFKLSKEGVAFVQAQMKRYETKRSAILPSLYRVQEENGGWIPPDAVSYLSQVMGIPESYIQEALTFYTLYNRKPVGRLQVQMCCNLSCAVNGAREILQHLCDHFKVKPGEVSADGLVSITRVECLGACDQAPMAQVNTSYIGPLKKETAVKQIKQVLNKDGT